MAVVAGTYLTGQAAGIREDLQDTIYNISPTDHPLLNLCKEFSAKDVFHEWQTDALADAANNRQIEGDDAAYTTPSPSTRVGNYCQILRKTVSVSGTLDEVVKAGRKKELAYQITKKGKEIMRDWERALVRNQASSAGADDVARSSAGLESWLTNFVVPAGATGSPATPGYSAGTVAAPTDSTVAGTFIEADLKTAIQRCWSVGGMPSIIMAGPFNKQKLSTFAGNATKTVNYSDPMKPGVVNAAVDVYVSDFGDLRVIPNRWQRDRTVFILDPDYLGVAYLRRMKLETLAKTGDAEKRLLIMEGCLVVQNEAAHSKIVDLTTTGVI